MKLSHEFRNYSLSHATMRHADLIPSFVEFLQKHDEDAYNSIMNDDDYADIINNDDYNDDELCYWLLDALFDMLNNIAPNGTIFGAHEGDGSDYGFWAYEDDDTYFDRYDICQAYWQLECDYNVSGVLQERKSNQRRNMSTGYQLHRMGVEVSSLYDGYDALSDNAKAIYNNWLYNHGL